MSYGDYSFELDGKSFEKEFVIERKGSITELCGNFSKGKTRFQNEFERARKEKCKVVLMIEDSLENLESGNFRSQFSPREIKNRINTWCNKFQIKFVFIEKNKAYEFIIKQFKEVIKHNGNTTETGVR